MNYELAKQLKDAGWPIQASAWTFYEGHEGSVPCPTLEELIDACGKRCSGVLRSSEGIWSATYVEDLMEKPIKYYRGLGETHREAVARLYIALHAI